MAREAQDREDLLRDATAFVTRVQFRLGESKIFAGFRADGATSIYIDQDPVYHFNSCGQLRRAFVDGKLLKAEGGRLVRLTRERSSTEVAMVRRDLAEGEQQRFCEDVIDRLNQVSSALSNGDYVIEGQVSANDSINVLDRLVAFLKTLDEVRIAASPRVRG